MAETRITTISDIHGCLDEAVELFDAAAEQLDIGPLFSYEKRGDAYDAVTWQGTADDYLVFNGDMINRGPQNREALQFVWDLQDAAAEQGDDGHVVHVLGNAEAYALQPEHTYDYFLTHGVRDADSIEQGRDLFYWWHMEEPVRNELRERVRSGDIVAAFQGPQFQYAHAGIVDGADLEELNEALPRAVSPGEDELYRELAAKDTGALWPSLGDVATVDTPQVIGHTPAFCVGTDGVHPRRYGNAININTIRDYVTGYSDSYGLLVEEPESVDAIMYDGERVERYPLN